MGELMGRRESTDDEGDRVGTFGLVGHGILIVEVQPREMSCGCGFHDGLGVRFHHSFN
jgi:hypothetical protein